MADIPPVLDAAAGHTKGDRHLNYGHAAINLGERTADLFTAYVKNMANHRFTATDVCNLMILVKVARLQENPAFPHFDSLVDIAGYASSAWEATHG
jgi:hypothetical protein